MKKKLNADMIRSELSGGSAFFPNYQGESSSAPAAVQPHPPVNDFNNTRPPSTPSTPVPPVRVVRDVLPVPPKRRVMKNRHPFDIYQDQYDSLKDISLAERKLGEAGSQSAVVREALDWVIAKKKKELGM